MHSKIPEDRYKALISTPVRLEIKHRILGPPEACVVQIRRYIEAGIGHLILIFIDLEDMDRFAKDVLPEFKSQ